MSLPVWLLRAAASAGQLASRSESRALVGPEADYYTRFRQFVLPLVDRLSGSRLDAVREADPAAYAGTFDASPEAVEETLWGAGFHRNPLAVAKVRDGEQSLGSWAYRESPDSERQVHVTLFAGDGGVDVYAHEEFSSINPDFVAYHFWGEPELDGRGVEMFRSLLPTETGDTGPANDDDRLVENIDPPDRSHERGYSRSR